jgi:hypothetical protein
MEGNLCNGFDPGWNDAGMPASASSSSLSDLKTLVSSFDDSRMNVQDLAFYLASHGFDAQPKGGYVEVDLGGHIYKAHPKRLSSGALQYSGLIPPSMPSSSFAGNSAKFSIFCLLLCIAIMVCAGDGNSARVYE